MWGEAFSDLLEENELENEKKYHPKTQKNMNTLFEHFSTREKNLETCQMDTFCYMVTS